MRILLPALFLSIALFGSFTAGAQEALVRGELRDSNGDPVPFATVTLKETRYAATSDREGAYIIRSRAGKYVLSVSALGYKPFEQEVELHPGQRLVLDIAMQQDVYSIENVRVEGKSMVQQVKESSYNVIAIDAVALRNTNLDLAGALDKVSGVKIRETGGVGSDASISLNGFTGKHVKVFMDGIPMEGSGTAFGINNIPVSLAERIEVYKGVVPVELGSDALGGAINIVTRQTANTYLDASYSYGSFNTHRSNLSLGHVTPKGFVVQFNAYQNYSDNSYKVRSQLLDLETGSWSDELQWFRRFHDMYRNEAAMVNVGVKGKKWATSLMVGATYSQETDEIQNAGIMRIVYGGYVTKSKSIIPTLTYEKRDLIVKNLNFSLSAKYNHNERNVADTVSRQYNWLGEYIEKNTRGEAGYSLAEYNNQNLYVTGNLRYSFTRKHFLSLNNVFNTYSRKTNDRAATSETVTGGTFMKRSTNKNVTGLSYRFIPNTRMNFTAFGKYYDITIKGPVNVSEGSTEQYELQSRNSNILGYGAAATYMILEGLQTKLSYEKSYRLPSERELFGDQILETGDMTLKPENSHNYNFNLTYNGLFSGVHSVYAEAGFVYRDTYNYIRRITEERAGGSYYTNHGHVRTLGFDFEARYFWSDKFTAGGNLTMQYVRSRQRMTTNGTPSINFNARMPNVPYTFANFDASYNFHDLFFRGSVLTLTYNMNYLYKFYRNFPTEGGTMLTVPEQLSHDLALTCSFRDARYNISFEARNITDEMLYDNYNLQKPGRSFSVKVRYFFIKVKDNPAGKSQGRSGGRHRQGRYHR